MNDLELAIEHAFLAQGSTAQANKAYLEFIKANFIIPIQRDSKVEQPEVLFLTEQNQVFLPVFTSKDYLDAWAVDIQDAIQILHLSGVNLLQGVGDGVTVCLNIGQPGYKEFNPGELARMRSIVLKLGLVKPVEPPANTSQDTHH
jgi:hypothetical protein